MAKEHIEKIGKNATARDINEMYDNGKIYYGSNPEMAMLYFERVVKDKPEASNYLAEYYYKKKIMQIMKNGQNMRRIEE